MMRDDCGQKDRLWKIPVPSNIFLKQERPLIQSEYISSTKFYPEQPPGQDNIHMKSVLLIKRKLRNIKLFFVH
jgi:hypothetical protein